MKRARLLSFMIVAAVLSGCQASMQQPPVGIGRGVEELKQSPCACTELPMKIPATFS